MSAPAVGNRWPELAVAALLVAVGALVVTDSVRVGTGWGDDGPRSGYFPFYIGLLLSLSGAWILGRELLRGWRQGGDGGAFAERAQLWQVVAVFVPMVVHVVLIYVIGIYIASALLIAYFMRRYGQFGWAAVAGVALGVPCGLFFVFERWFLVPLPKGPVEHLLGL